MVGMEDQRDQDRIPLVVFTGSGGSENSAVSAHPEVSPS
jgi:hypothetical protein